MDYFKFAADNARLAWQKGNPVTRAQLLAYRGALKPLIVTPTKTLSRSLSNGNYYVERPGKEPVMVGYRDAERWLSEHVAKDVPQTEHS